MIDRTITNLQKIKVTIAPKTSKGLPARVDGFPTWTVTSGEGTLEVAPDSMSGYIVSSDVLGDTIVLIEADADLTGKVETIGEIVQIHVVAPNSPNLGIQVDDPINK